MACYVYNWFDSKAKRSTGRDVDCYDFVEIADKWIDSTLERAQRSWLTICFVATIIIHCFLVFFLSNHYFNPPGAPLPSTQARFWGEATTNPSTSWCERDYGASNYVAEFHNAYSNLLFVLVGSGSLHLSLQHKLPRRMSILAIWIVLMGLSGAGMHITLHREWQVVNDVNQAGMMITLYWCRACPYGGAAGFTTMAVISCAHFVAASACLALQVDRFAEGHMCIMVHSSLSSQLSDCALAGVTDPV